MEVKGGSKHKSPSKSATTTFQQATSKSPKNNNEGRSKNAKNNNKNSKNTKPVDKSKTPQKAEKPINSLKTHASKINANNTTQKTKSKPASALKELVNNDNDKTGESKDRKCAVEEEDSKHESKVKSLCEERYSSGEGGGEGGGDDKFSKIPETNTSEMGGLQDENLKLKNPRSFANDEISNLKNYNCGDLNFDENENEAEVEYEDEDDDDYTKDIARDLVDVVRSDDIDSLKEALEVEDGDDGGGRGRLQEMVRACVTCDSRGLSAFTLAGELNRVEMVKVMVKAGVDVNARNLIGGWTALHCACSQGHVAMVKLLLSSAADVEVGDNEGWTPLHFAASNGCLEALKQLLAVGCDMNKMTAAEGYSPLHLACQQGGVAVVEELLGRGAVMEKKDQDGWGVLHCACQHNKKNVVELLLKKVEEKGGDVKEFVAGRTNEGVVAVYIAAQNNCGEILDLLLPHCDLLQAFENDGSSPIHVASQNGHERVVRRLIHASSQVINLSSKSESAWSPIHLACQENRVAVLKVLVEEGADVMKLTSEGHTALHIAAEAENVECVEVLMGVCADRLKFVLMKNLMGWNAFHYVAQNGNVEVMTAILKDFKLKDFNGDGKSNRKEQNNSKEINDEKDTKSISEINDDTKIDGKNWKSPSQKNFRKRVVASKTKDGESGLLIAVMNKNEEVAKRIVRTLSGKDDDDYEDTAETGFGVSSVEGGKGGDGGIGGDASTGCTEEKRNCDAGSANDEGDCEEELNENVSEELLALWTLQAAVENDDVMMLELLIKNGLDLNARDENGWSVLSFIAEKGRVSCLEVVLRHGLYEVEDEKDEKCFEEKIKKSDEDKIENNSETEISKDFEGKNNEVTTIKRLSAESPNLDPTSPSPVLPEPYTGVPFDDNTNTGETDSNKKDTIHKKKTEKSMKKLKGKTSRVNLDSQNDEGQTALFIACHEGHKEVVVALLDRGGRPDVVDYMGWSPLHAAAEKGFTDIVDVLLNHTPKPPTPFSASSLDVASFSFSDKSPQNQVNETFSYATSKAVSLDINKRTYHGFTPLYLATQSNHIQTVKYLLTTALADVNIGENQGFCPVHVASQYGYVECLKCLFEVGALGNRSDSSGWTPLHFAVQENGLDVAQLLLNQGLDLDAETGDGVQALTLATSKKSTPLMQLLLQYGAQTDIIEPATGLTPLHIACRGGHLQGVKLLIEAGCDVEVESKYDHLKPLYLAIRHSKDGAVTGEIVDCLLNEGASANITGKAGSSSALHLASQKNLSSVVRSLVAHGAVVDAVDSDGWSPLMVACRYGNVQAAKALLELGATTDVTTLEQQVPQNDHQGSPTDHQTNATFDHLKNSDVVSPLLLATQNGHIGVVELLVLWSCGLDHTTNDGKTALYCAAQYGDFDMVQMLLYNGADPNIKDKFGFIALHPACYKGHMKVVESLVKGGSEVDVRAKDGSRPIQLADSNGHEDIVEWLVVTQQAKPPNYELQNDWGTQVISYFKNVIVSAFKHGVDEYNRLQHNDEEDAEGASGRMSLKRKATIEKARVRVAENSGGFSRSYSVRKSISKQSRKAEDCI